MTAQTPFADGVWPLLRAGWHPLPLPAGRKAWPPKGTTGSSGVDLRPADLMAEIETGPGQNIATRAPVGVLGLDVDHYGDKTGADTLARLATDLGPLPATWWSTSRDDGQSGIRWFRVPEGKSWRDLPDVEAIRRGHRYAVVAPSVHPEGRSYFWGSPNGAKTTDPPQVDDLPRLPDRWVDRLSQRATGRTFEVLDDDVIRTAIWHLPDGKPCDLVSAAVDLHSRQVVRSVHGSTLTAVADLLYLGRVERHRGVVQALLDVREAFTRAVTEHRSSDRVARLRVEWNGIVRWSASRAASFGGQRVGACNCASVLDDLLAEEATA